MFDDFILKANWYFTWPSHLPRPLPSKMTFGVHVLYLQALSWLHTNQARKNGFLPFTCKHSPLHFFISSPFFISFSTCLEPRGYGKWNCQRARNRGVLRQVKCFLHSMQAGPGQARYEGGRLGQSWAETLGGRRPGRRLLISACLHVVSCPRLFSRIAQVILGR